VVGIEWPRGGGADEREPIRIESHPTKARIKRTAIRANDEVTQGLQGYPGGRQHEVIGAFGYGIDRP